MGEREPQHEGIGQGELYYIIQPGIEDIVIFGYGLTVEPYRKDLLAGLLVIDRPFPADPAWLQMVANLYGECRLAPVTDDGDRGLVCQMQIEPDSLAYVRQIPADKSVDIQQVLMPLLDELPAPVLKLHWDEASRLWQSEWSQENELPPEIKEVFERTGYGCLAVESNIGVVHVCYASDADIDGFEDKPVRYQWQLIEMPTAPLIRLDVIIDDNPAAPFKFESFLNVAEEDQARVLDQLANQGWLFLAFYGDDLAYRFTKIVDHDEQQWQQLDELVARANAYWESLPPNRRDFDLAKEHFMRRFV